MKHNGREYRYMVKYELELLVFTSENGLCIEEHTVISSDKSYWHTKEQAQKEYSRACTKTQISNRFCVSASVTLYSYNYSIIDNFEKVY